MARAAVPWLAATLLLACAGPTPGPLEPTPQLGERAAELLAGAIRLRSVNPPGDERPVAEYFKEQLLRAGLEARIVETPRGASQVGRAAVWGRLRGSGERPAVVLLSHLDVVPAEPEGWSVDPFAGVRSREMVYGRGARDAKGVAVVQLLALAELAGRRELRRDVLFLATPDEETGGIDGAGWIARERPDLVEGARWVLTEGGGVVVDPDRGRAAWHVGVTEKSPCWMRVTASGKPGHSSMPPREAAVPRLVAALDRVLALEMPVRVVPEVERMFAALAALAPPEDAAGFSDLSRALADDPSFRGRFLARPFQAGLVRDTLAMTVLQGSTRTNVLPAEAVAHLDVRLLPDGSCDAFLDRVRGAIREPGVRVEPLLHFESLASPPEGPLWEAIESVAARFDPGSVVVPRVGLGFTDAHYFRALGLDAYGFVPRWRRAGESLGVHGVDERVAVSDLARGVAALVTLLEELDQLD